MNRKYVFYSLLLKSMAKNSPVLVYVKDKNHKFSFTTDNLKKFYNGESLIGKTDYDVFPIKFADEYRKNDTLVREQKIQLNEVEPVSEDETTKVYHSTKFMINDDYLAGISVDITNEYQKQIKLLEVNKFLTHVNYIIRHDLYSSINLVKQFYKKIEERVTVNDLDNLRIKGAFKALGACTDRLVDTYSGIYDLSSMVDSNKEMPRKTYDLNESLLKRLETTVLFTYVKIDKLGIVNANESLLNTAIYNFIKNGVTYNNSKSKKIHIYRENNDLIIQDNGIGINQKDFKKYLSPYKRGNMNKGSGLGLTISNMILNNHNHKLYFQKLENGTKIRIFDIFIV